MYSSYAVGFIWALLEPVTICVIFLLLVEFQLYQKFGEHRVDSIQCDVGVSQLMFRIQCIPDVADCAVVLDDSTHGLNDKGY